MSKQKIDASFFISNRQRLRAAHHNDEAIVLTGNSYLQKSADAFYPFRQDSTFWYFTGVTEPDVVLVIDGKKEYLIMPSVDPVRDLFDGAMDAAAISKKSGIKRLLTHEEGDDLLRSIVSASKRVASLASPVSYIESMYMFTQPSRARLLSRLQKINPSLEVHDIRTLCATLRSVKQPQEIDAIRAAATRTAGAFSALQSIYAAASSEQELHAEMAKYALLHDSSFGYEPIIANGKQALTLHYCSNNQPLDHSKVTLFDIGLTYGMYSADVSRSIATRPTDRQRSVYDAVLDVQQYACSLLRSGVDLVAYEKSVVQKMGEVLQRLGLIHTIQPEQVRTLYPHATSHFLGLDVHDVGDHTQPLPEHAVITVEPGIYIKEEGIGIRIEDNVLITKTGIQNLTEMIPKSITSLA